MFQNSKMYHACDDLCMYVGMYVCVYVRVYLCVHEILYFSTMFAISVFTFSPSSTTIFTLNFVFQ